MKKRFFALLMAAILLIGLLGGCSGDDKPTENNVVDPSEVTDANNDGNILVGAAYCTLAEEFAVELQKGIQEQG